MAQIHLRIADLRRQRKVTQQELADRVELVTPDRPEYEEKKRDFLDYNDWNTGLSDQEREQVILHLLSHGLDRREARQYCDRNRVITGFFREHQSAGYTFVKGHMITYGKKSVVN